MDMDTLTNVDNRRSGNLTPSARINTCTVSSKNISGVSVENAINENVCWFVLRVSYHREQKAYKWLTSQGIETYLPFHFVKKEVDGKLRRVQESLLPNLIFVNTQFSKIDALIRSATNTLLSFYYNHFEFTPDGKNPPLIVPTCQMDNFIRLTSIDNDHILFVSPDKCHYKSGDEVIVTDGPFKGVKGRIARVQRQQRVVVEIDGIGCVTTAYVPSGFITHNNYSF